MWLSCCFVLGFSVVFVALGASASLLGQWLMAYRQEANLVAGLLIVLMGLFMLGWWSMPALQRDWAPGANARGRTPHSGLFAGHRLCRRLDALHRPDTRSHTGAQFHPRQRRNGHVVSRSVFARPGTLVSRNRAVHRAFSQASARIQPLRALAGLVLIIMGIMVLTGQMTWFATWMLSTFPVLGRLG